MLQYDDKENIKIDIDIFKEKLKEFEKKDDLIISESIIDKYNELLKTYNCFTTKYDPKSVWEKKKYKTRNILYNNKNKLYTFTTNINNNNDNNTKNIIGLLNKITENNKNIILNTIIEILKKNNNEENEKLFNIVFNYIEKKFDIIYIEILKLFHNNNTIIYNIINNYILHKLWLPNEYIINNNILNDNLYNEYCDYIKWKNKQLNIIKYFIFIIKEDKHKYNELYNNLCDDLYKQFNNYLEKNYYKYILDYILELLNILLYETNDIFNNLKKIDTSKLDNSTKFLIYDIIKK